MKLTRILISTLISIFIFVACSTDNKKEERTSEKNETTNLKCTYSYIGDSTSLKWTAYKFNERTGVSGTFDNITVTNTQSSEDKLGVLVGAEFSIATSSINSGNIERDPKVVEFFFGNLTNTGTITGKIVSVNEGEAVITLNINGITADVVGKIVEGANRVALSVSVDMKTFDGMDAVAALNEKCYDKHTGEDGESKLWPDISIEVTTVLNKECI